jgi:hypothetical protein
MYMNVSYSPSFKGYMVNIQIMNEYSCSITKTGISKFLRHPFLF